MIEPKEIEINGKTFILSKLPATVGREVLYKYPTSNVPRLGDYAVSQEIMLKLMSYVAVRIDEERTLELKTEALVNNHIPNAETLILLEKEMFKYNFDFFTSGKASSFLEQLEKQATTKGIKMLTSLLDNLSQAGKRH